MRNSSVRLITLFVLVHILILAVVTGSSLNKVYAHPGNTASDGCHFCRTNCESWGEVYGQRHCHGYTPEPETEPDDYYVPEPDPPDYEYEAPAYDSGDISSDDDVSTIDNYSEEPGSDSEEDSEDSGLWWMAAIFGGGYIVIGLGKIIFDWLKEVWETW